MVRTGFFFSYTPPPPIISEEDLSKGSCRLSLYSRRWSTTQKGYKILHAQKCKFPFKMHWKLWMWICERCRILHLTQKSLHPNAVPSVIKKTKLEDGAEQIFLWTSPVPFLIFSLQWVRNTSLPSCLLNYLLQLNCSKKTVILLCSYSSLLGSRRHWNYWAVVLSPPHLPL